MSSEKVVNNQDDVHSSSPNDASLLIKKEEQTSPLVENDSLNQNSNATTTENKNHINDNGVPSNYNTLSNVTENELRMAIQYNSMHYQGFENNTALDPPLQSNIPNIPPEQNTQKFNHTINMNMYNQNQVPIHDPHNDHQRSYEQPISYQQPTMHSYISDDPNFNQNSWHDQTGEFYSQEDTTPTCAVLKCFANLTQLNLQRSFCFGAIDGLLTGSSITFAASGLGLFSPSSSLTQRMLLVVLTFAACASDGLCMAIGHVWSTFVVNESMAKERQGEMDNFQNSRGEAKARLVDLLLMRGMLKIDAMSIADTLEGYPDVFLGALTGDILAQSHPNLQESQVPNNVGGSSEYDDYVDDDEDTYHFHQQDAESRAEAVFMMMAFSMFSIIPPTIYAFVPGWINPSLATNPIATYYDPYGGQHAYHSTNETDTGISPTSVTVAVLSFIMLFLGFWKR